MFITLTVSTVKKSNISSQGHTPTIKPTIRWRKALNMKKRNLWLKIRDWRKSFKKKPCSLKEQGAMF